MNYCERIRELREENNFTKQDISKDFKEYINDDVLVGNCAMWHIKKLK